MKKKILNVAIITARKGSIRIKNKNLKKFFGKPIIYYSIKALKKSKIFDKIYLSTNCDNTERVAKKYGVKDIIRRPNYLSTNKVGTITVINDVLKKIEKKNLKPNYVCCIYPAAPLTKFQNIKYSFLKLRTMKKIDFIYPSTRLRKNSFDSGKKLIQIKKIQKKEGIINDIFLDAGQFWYAKAKTWKKSKTIYSKKSYTFLIEESHSDINSMTDWMNVKKIFLKNRKRYVN